jgi:hypothetical protein
MHGCCPAPKAERVCEPVVTERGLLGAGGHVHDRAPERRTRAGAR